MPENKGVSAEPEVEEAAINAVRGVVLRPTREKVLRHINEVAPVSATQIAKNLQLPRSSVAEEVRWLHAEGLIEEAEARPRRGAVERLFRATDASRWIDGEAWDTLPLDQKKRLIMKVVRSLLARLSEAEAANDGDFLPDSCWASTTYVLDEQGWSELAAIHRRAVLEAEQLAKVCESRLAAASEERMIKACSAHFLFDMRTETS